MKEPWHTFLLLGLVTVIEQTPHFLTTPVDNLPAFFVKLKLTNKGRELLHTFLPEVIVEKAVEYDKYQVAVEWMPHISPEYLPRFLTHPIKWIRYLAQSRTQFIEEYLEAKK